MALDDTSLAIGQLQKAVENLVERFDKYDGFAEQMSADVSEVKTDVRGLRTEMMAVTGDVSSMKPDVAHYRSVRARAAYLATGIAAGSAFVGATLQKWIIAKWL